MTTLKIVTQLQMSERGGSLTKEKDEEHSTRDQPEPGSVKAMFRILVKVKVNRKSVKEKF